MCLASRNTASPSLESPDKHPMHVPPACARPATLQHNIYLRNVNKVALFKRVIDRQEVKVCTLARHQILQLLASLYGWNLQCLLFAAPCSGSGRSR